VDKHRQELLQGAPDAPAVDDLRNLVQLCPNHHTSFDQYEWTLVEREQQLQDGTTATGFWVRATPLKPQPDPDITLLMQTFIRFSQPERAPPAYMFLLKQLGRFKVPCRVCQQLFLPASIWGHYNGAHKSAEQKALWKDLPHLLPRPCDCDDRGDTPWQLYLHVVGKHSELLFV
jgi:hypothetical protein